MPSQSKISSSVMEEAYNISRDFATDVLKLFQCNRRKNAPATPPARTTRQSKMVRNTPKQCDSDASKSTEPGDASNNEFSDKSYLTDGSTSGSKAMRKNAMRAPAARFAPSGLSAPPGLDAPTGLNGNAMSFVPSCGKGSRTDSGLNAAAPCFKPSFATVAPALQTGLSQLESQGFNNPQQLRQSIKMLKGALEEWESNLPATPAPAAAPSPAAGESQGLFEALAKLTPAEAATVRSMLDCKLAPYSAAPAAYAAPASMPPGQLNGPAWRMEQQRPFTPFRGATRPASDQARPFNAPRNAAPKGPPGLALVKEDDNSLSKQLRDLSEMDNKCVLMVRKINRLGLNSGPPLQEHFSKFGSVDRVMVTPTRSKVQYGQSARVRPAPLGFVVMSKPEEVAAILAHGAEHVVQGQSIGVFPFESHTIDTKE